MSKSSHSYGILGELKLYKIPTRARNPIRLGIPPQGMRDDWYVSPYDRPKNVRLAKRPQSDELVPSTNMSHLRQEKPNLSLLQRARALMKGGNSEVQADQPQTGSKIQRIFRGFFK